MNKDLRVKLFTICFFSIMLNGLTLVGQNSTTSPYSMFGIGEIEQLGTGRSLGMGGAGLAVGSSNYINMLNPASLSNLDSLSAIFEIGVDASYSHFSANDKSQSVYTGNFKYFGMGFRVAQNWGLSLGIRPYSSVGYTIISNHLYNENNSYQVQYQGSGGLNQFYISNGYSPIKGLSLGLNASFLFGAIERSDRYYMNTSSSYKAYSNNRYFLHNLNLEYGLQYMVETKREKFSIGLTFSNKQKLKAEQQKTMLFYTGDTLKYEQDNLDDYVIPRSFGIGIAYQNNRLLFAADYSKQFWKGNISFNSEAKIKDSQKLSLGIELIPSNKMYSSYMEKVNYRLGAYYHDTYLSFDDNDIREYAITFGLGFPINNNKNAVNLSFELGQHGNYTEDMIMETFGIFHLNFRLNERWFSKPKYH